MSHIRGALVDCLLVLPALGTILFIPVIMRQVVPFGMPPANVPRLLTLALPFFLILMVSLYVGRRRESRQRPT